MNKSNDNDDSDDDDERKDMKLHLSSDQRSAQARECVMEKACCALFVVLIFMEWLIDGQMTDSK